MKLAAKTVLAIDPGSQKCGMVVVHRDDEGELSILGRDIAPTAEVVDRIRELINQNPVGEVILGNGTTSRKLAEDIREHFPSLTLMKVDERDTTMEARARYWEHNKRTGWRRLLPATLQTPPEPVDDYAAYVIAERVLGN